MLFRSDRPRAALGTHYLLDMSGCSSPVLDDELALTDLLAEAAREAGATVLGRHHHRFEPHGVSALCILAESHISAHTWPELGSAVFDVFTCGDTARPEVACALLVERLAPAQHSLQRVDRGVGIAVPVGA